MLRLRYFFSEHEQILWLICGLDRVIVRRNLAEESAR